MMIASAMGGEPVFNGGGAGNPSFTKRETRFFIKCSKTEYTRLTNRPVCSGIPAPLDHGTERSNKELRRS